MAVEVIDTMATRNTSTGLILPECDALQIQMAVKECFHLRRLWCVR